MKKIYEVHAPRVFFRLVSLIKSYQPDIVQTFHFKSDTFGVLAAKIAGAPRIISSRRDMGHFKSARQVLLNKLLNPLIDRYITVCDRVACDLNRVEGVEMGKMQTFYNGVDLARYEVGDSAKLKARRKLGIKEDNFVVGTVSWLRPEKDVQLLLSAMSEISREVENLTVLIVGGSRGFESTRESLERYCRETGLIAKTVFAGFTRDVRDYVQAMDVACLTPSLNEGLSNAILEKMAMGKPVIATDVGGNAELVVDGITGFIIPPGDKDALVRCISILYKDPKRRESMGIKARKRVEEYFTLDKMIRNTEGFYFNCLGSSRSNCYYERSHE
jgi:glycosyltransferase involved in cell wall biosynthesis